MWKGKADALRSKFDAFFAANIVPNDELHERQVAENRARGQAWAEVPIVIELTTKAQQADLSNLFLPSVSGLTQAEYAPFAETMGRYPWSSQVFNCDAPDTGNMETLHLYGNAAQQQKWLQPLLRQEIRSCIGMTEPDVASSDPTNISTTAVRDDHEYVINGRKWWITGFGHPKTRVLLVLCLTNPDAAPHKRHSIILVPKNAPGVRGVRPLTVFGADDAPIGHWEIEFTNVRVPVANRLQEEGDGFAMAQGRLGPGRVHHCMRSLGMAERALELMVQRSAQRTAFKSKLARNAVIRHQIAESRVEIATARQLVLHTARLLDTIGAKHARQEIAMIKVVAPRAACSVIDRAIQVHGGAGVSSDTVLPLLYAGQRSLRIADGPDDVHLMTVGNLELRRQQARLSKL